MNKIPEKIDEHNFGQDETTRQPTNNSAWGAPVLVARWANLCAIVTAMAKIGKAFHETVTGHLQKVYETWRW